MRVPTQEEIERTRERYEGKRIELIEMPEDPHPVEPGTVGTCEMVDGLGHLEMKWDDGRTLSLIPGVDRFKVLPPAGRIEPIGILDKNMC